VKQVDFSETEVLVLAPFGRDAAMAVEVLGRHGIHAEPVKLLSELCARVQKPAGALLIAEEALTIESARELKAALSSQESWSNLPIILMTSQAEHYFATENILELFGISGSISLLERPFRILNLLSSVGVALQARKRQYEMRGLLAEQIRAVEQQKLAVAQRDEFLSIASHELKTPITSMKLQIQTRKRFVKRGDQSVFSPDKVISLLDFTDTQLSRLSRLVDDMLDITRIVNGKLSLKCEHMELGLLVKEVLEGFSTQFQAADCPVDMKIENRVAGSWDRYRIEQVVANIFSNAIKYGPGKSVQVTVRSRDGKAQLLVKDQGTGVASENQERIFQRFERAVSSSGGISGLGLGLFITRQILELHNGTIRIESALGTGSTFIIELPAQAERAAYATR
jgi:signal transduction histidine kinase